MSSEVRITSETGGAKGQKLERYSLIPVEAMDAVARVYAAGAMKYDDHNWRRGYNWSLSYDALKRHAGAFWNGEDYDEESSKLLGQPSPHLAAVVFHALSLLVFMTEHPELDDRPSTVLAKENEETPDGAEESTEEAREAGRSAGRSVGDYFIQELEDRGWRIHRHGYGKDG